MQNGIVYYGKQVRRQAGLIVGHVLVAFAFTFICSHAQAGDTLRFEVAGGQCRYQQAPEGLYQWRYDETHQSQYKDNGCGEIGIAGDINSRFGWAVRYTNLGRAHTRGITATCPNDDCNLRDASVSAARPECADHFNEQNCEYQWNGDGGIKGINFSVNTEIARIGKVSLEGELGVLLYQMKWNIQVFPMGCSDGDCPWRETANQQTGYYLSPMGGLVARFALTKNASLFAGSRLYMRTSQHIPISSGVTGYSQTWVAGVQTSF